MKGRLPPTTSTEAMLVTGSMPRPVIARSVGFEVDSSAPFASTSQTALVPTPPALKSRPPPEAGERPSFTVIDAKSISARL